MKKILLFLLLIVSFNAFSQISITSLNAPYTENFNSMGTTGTTYPSGWVGIRYAGSGTLGQALSPTVPTTSSNSGAVYNAGPVGSSTDDNNRSLGTLASGSTVPMFGASFINNSGSQALSVLMTGLMKQWKTGSNSVVEDILFEYSVNATSIDDAGATWTPLSGMDLVEKLTTDNTNSFVDGNLPANQTSISGSANVTIPSGGIIWIRWSDTNDAGSDGLYAIDDFSINLSSTVLPISLTSFTGKAVDKNILLNWNTASEENNNYFEIRHSADGKTFTSIGKVNGSGTSKVSKDYSFVDENPYAGTTYYKLVQHDFDGKTSESKVIGVASNISAASLSVYATSSDVKITLSSPNKTAGTFEVFDIGGRKLATTSISVNKGYNTVSIPVSLQPGVHFVRYTSEGIVSSVKFMR